MNLIDAELIETKWLTCGNESAASFLRLWRSYVHGIDDIIDGEITTPEKIIAVFMQAAFVYSHPFFIEHRAALLQLAVNCTNAFADTVPWEKSDVPWKREFADHYRHFAAEMVLAIAFITGGYNHMREASGVLREICYKEHHNAKGEPV